MNTNQHTPPIVVVLWTFAVWSFIGLPTVHAQNEDSYSLNIIDSLYQELKLAKTVPDSVVIYCRIGRRFWNVDLDSSEVIGRKAIKLSREKEYPPGESMGMAVIAMAKLYNGEPEKAITYCKQIIALNNHPKSVYRANLTQGIYHFKRKNIYAALGFYREALNIATELNEKPSISTCHNSIGLIRNYLKEYEYAIASFKKALALAEEDKDQYYITQSLKNISYSYYSLKDYENAKKYLFRVIASCNELNDNRTRTLSQSLLARVYLYQNDLAKADEFNIKAKAGLKLMSKTPVAETNIAYTDARIYLLRSQFSEALEYAQKGFKIAHTAQNRLQLSTGSELLAEIYEKLERYDQMLEYTKLYKVYLDTLWTENTNKGIYEEFRRLELRNLELEKNQELAAANAKNKTYFLYILVIVVVSVLVIASILYYKNKKLVQLNNTKSEFLSTVSHEMKTPLNTIFGFTKLLEAPLNDEKKDIYLKEIKTASSDLYSKVKNILFLAAREKPKSQLNIEEFNLYNFCIAIHKKYQPLATAKQLTFNFEIDDSLKGVRVSFDKDKLNEIIEILLENALKFTKKGSVGFSISNLRPIQENWIDATFVIQDTGIGIEQMELDRIFNPFHQVDNTMQRGYQGLGLSLAVVKRYMTLINEEIRVESIPDKGTIFRFNLSLPVAHSRGIIEGII